MLCSPYYYFFFFPGKKDENQKYRKVYPRIKFKKKCHRGRHNTTRSTHFPFLFTLTIDAGDREPVELSVPILLPNLVLHPPFLVHLPFLKSEGGYPCVLLPALSAVGERTLNDISNSARTLAQGNLSADLSGGTVAPPSQKRHRWKKKNNS